MGRSSDTAVLCHSVCDLRTQGSEEDLGQGSSHHSCNKTVSVGAESGSKRPGRHLKFAVISFFILSFKSFLNKVEGTKKIKMLKVNLHITPDVKEYTKGG